MTCPELESIVVTPSPPPPPPPTTMTPPPTRKISTEKLPSQRKSSFSKLFSYYGCDLPPVPDLGKKLFQGGGIRNDDAADAAADEPVRSLAFDSPPGDAKLERLDTLRRGRPRRVSTKIIAPKRVVEVLAAWTKIIMARWVAAWAFVLRYFKTSQRSTLESASSSSSLSSANDPFLTYDDLLAPPSPRLVLRLATLPRKTLILDLDETLIHSTQIKPRKPTPIGVDFAFGTSQNGRRVTFGVYKRPHVDRFLDVVSRWFDLAIFTAAVRNYANVVVENLDAGRGLFPVGRRFFRRDCELFRGGYSKNVRLVESDLASVAIVDNTPAAYRDYAENGIPIKSWTDDPKDDQLLLLLPFLDALRFVEDVRGVLGRKNWGKDGEGDI